MKLSFVRSVGIVGLGLIGLALVSRPRQDLSANLIQGKEQSALAKDLVGWTHEFGEDKADLKPTGRNRYFILEPSFYLILEKGDTRIVITVLNETKLIDGVETRVVEEKETKSGQLVEITRDYFAISAKTNSVYYLGEDVDIYKGGKVVAHTGTWHSGVKGARYGIMIPGTPLIGGKYYQEVAPEVALDRAEVVSVSETVVTKAGTFKNCLKTEETTPLEPDAKDYKHYAPGIGQITDGDLVLVEYGFLKNKK